MHPYSTDTYRVLFVGYVGIGASAITLVLNPFLNSTVGPFFASTIPVLGAVINDSIFFLTVTSVLAVFLTLYDSYLWRVVSRFSRPEEIPDLQGRWVQKTPSTKTSDSTGTGQDVNETTQLTIGQTWREIEIAYLDSEEEYWHSDSAAIWVDQAPHTELVCTYQSESLSEEGADSDRGTIRLRHVREKDPDQLIGRRYTESGKRNEKLVFERIDKPFVPMEYEIRVDDA